MKAVIKHIILTVLFLFLSINLFAEIVDLNMRPMMTRIGFEKEWIESMPEESADWRYIAPSEERSLKVKSIFEDKIPERTFLSFKKYKADHFTFVTSFELTEEVLNSGKFLGLLLSSIGVNWEIYLNGQKIRSEVYLDDSGYVQIPRKKNSFAVELPSGLLKKENILGFHIIGAAHNEETGFYRSLPYKIGYYSQLYYPIEDLIALFLISIYVFIGIYHINLYLNYSKSIYNMYYGFFSLSVAVYMFARTDAIYGLFLDSSIVSVLEFCSLYMIFPFFAFFSERILYGKIRIFPKIYMGVFIFASLVTAIAVFPVKIDILRIWQMTAILPLLYCMIYVLGFAFVRDYKDVKKNNYYGETGWPVIIRVFRFTVSGNLFLSASIMSFCVVYDIIISLFLRYPIYSSKYGFAFFIVSITFILTNRFLNSQKKIEKLNVELNQHVEYLKDANKDITVSQKRYEHLVEESNDIIFSLSEDLEVISVNNAVENHLKFKKDEIQGKNFIELIYKESEDDFLTLNLVYEQLDKAISQGESVNFKVVFKSYYEDEPVEMRVYMIYICEDDKREIIGRASPIIEDNLIKYLKTENQEYEISNYLLLAEDMSYRLTRNIAKCIPVSQVNILRIAVREIVFNAIEHGNLGITYDEKTKAMEDGNYIEFVTDRQNNPENISKRVKISYTLNEDSVKYVVEDEGTGFDYEKFLNEDGDSVNQEFLSHGRGILMTKNIFDDIIYEKNGSSVTLIKYFYANGQKYCI